MGRLLSVSKYDPDLDKYEVVEAYEYDPNGTRSYENNVLRGITRSNFNYSAEDCLLNVGGTTYEYDADGFLTT